MTTRPEKLLKNLFAALLVVQAFLLFYLAVTMPVTSAYEGDIFNAADQMLKSGNWMWPETAQNSPVFHTPILPYWLAAAGHALVPQNIAGFRLLNILIYLIALQGFFSVIKNYLNARTAFYSCCIVASGLPFIWQMQLATPDGLVAIFAAGALAGFYLMLKTNMHKYFWLLYGCLGAGLLSKGFISLLLPLLIMMVYLMFKIKMNGAIVKKLNPGKGILLVAAIVVPWYAYAGLKDGGNWLSIFWNDFQWQRYMQGDLHAEGAFYLPFLYILLMLLPFGIYFPRSFSFSWKYRFKRDFLLISDLSVLTVLLFFAFSATFYPHYLLPAIPFAAVAIAYRFDTISGRPFLKMGMYAEHVLVALLSVVIPAIVLYLSPAGATEDYVFTPQGVLLLVILPAGTAVTFLLWAKKRTDEGMAIMVLTYNIFFGLLLPFAQNKPELRDWLQQLIF